MEKKVKDKPWPVDLRPTGCRAKLYDGSLVTIKGVASNRCADDRDIVALLPDEDGVWPVDLRPTGCRAELCDGSIVTVGEAVTVMPYCVQYDTDEDVIIFFGTARRFSLDEKDVVRLLRSRAVGS